MSDALSQPLSDLTFEEVALSRSAQLFADPLTDSTRMRQSFLLLLSTLSLALFFGIVVPEKVSFPGFEMRIATTPLTTAGTPSTSWTGIAKGALRFNRVLCPVLVYSVLAFWLSVYRDHEAAKHSKKLAELELERADLKQDSVNQVSSREWEAISERLRRASDEYNKKRDEIWRQAEPIMDEYRMNSEPLEAEHTKVVEEIKRLEKEGTSSPELENRLREISWQIHVLDVEGAKASRPIHEALDSLEQDAELNRLQKQVDDNFRALWPRLDKMREIRRIMGEAQIRVRLWRKFWYLLEVVFPSVIGLVAITVPFLPFS